MRTLALLFAVMICASAHAQQSPSGAPGARPPAATPPPDQLEPAVDTTATTTPDAAPARASAAASAARPAPKGDKAPASASGKAAGANPVPAGKGTDRVELETTEITGNRELPKVLYIVPWKRSDLGDLVGKPANSLLDEVLQPIDRDVFLRENRYYDAVKPDAPRPKAGTAPGSGDKP